MLISWQNDGKWSAKGQFRPQSDHFPRKDRGEFQNNNFLTENSCHDCAFKLLNTSVKAAFVVSLQMASEKHCHLRSHNVIHSMRCAMQNKGISLKTQD